MRIHKSQLLYRSNCVSSGLDANGALSIVRFLRKLATESGIAILCTIHQPSTVLFQEFDDLLLLARGGREVYFGPIGETGQTAVDFFDRNGAAGATSDMNPAEYILDAIRTPPSGPRTWPEIWEASPENAAALEEIDAIISARKDVPITREMRTLEYAMPLPAQIFAVTGRVWNNYWRDASYGVSKMVSGISTGLIGGVIFLNSGNTVIEMQSRSFAVFLIVILYPLITSAVQPKFLQLRTLYEVRERNSKIYSAPAWITAMAIVEIPYAILASIFFFLPWYYMIGLPSDSATAGYVFFLILLFNIWATYISMWTVAMCPDLNIVGMANTFLTLVTNTFS